jgi:hypothetical protein
MQHPASKTPSTHYLFLRIVAAVGQSSAPMTVSDLGRTLKADRGVIAQCIALHLYLERKRVAELPIPPPADYWVPKVTDVITPKMLRPRQVGRMRAVEAAIKEALGGGSRI